VLSAVDASFSGPVPGLTQSACGKRRCLSATVAKPLDCLSARCPTLSPRGGPWPNTKKIGDAVEMLVDHEERIRRCKTMVTRLPAEVVEAKRGDGLSSEYIDDLELRLSHFSRNFGDRAIAAVTVEELDNWLHDLPLSPNSRANCELVHPEDAARVGTSHRRARQRTSSHSPIGIEPRAIQPRIRASRAPRRRVS
jgi:hypothetical protein